MFLHLEINLIYFVTFIMQNKVNYERMSAKNVHI